MKRLLLNVVGFKVAWLVCAFGGPVNPWLPVPIIALLLAVHLSVGERWQPEARLILSVGLLGAVVDTALGLAGVMQYAYGTATTVFAPPWLIALWMSFATVLPYGLRWLSFRPLIAVLLGAVAGPVSYYGGSKTGAIVFGDSLVLSLVIVGAVWAVVLPAIGWLSRQDYFDVHSDHEGAAPWQQQVSNER